MTETEFHRAADRTRLQYRARSMAKRYLVDGITNASAIAREFDVQPQTVRNAIKRVQREHYLLTGAPRGWHVVTVVVPPDTDTEVRDIERRAWRAAGMLVD